MDSRLRFPWMVVPVALAIGACAAPTPYEYPAGEQPQAIIDLQAETPASVLGAVDLQLGGMAPRPGSADALLRGNVNVGDEARPLRYQANFTFAPGDVLSKIGSDAAEAPQGLGHQRIDQRMTLRSPPLAGAPVAIGLSTALERRWTTTGFAQTQRERAELRWSSSLAQLDLHWSDTASALGTATALDCNVRGTLRVPVAGDERSGRHSLSLIGNDCTVRAANSRYGSLAAQNWGLAYAWERASQASRIRVSRITPFWGDALDGAGNDSSYEFGVSHTIDSGPWKAEARVTLRQTPGWQDHDADGRTATGSQAFWTSDTALTRRLRHVDVSAIWISGADPLWFTPERGNRREHFGLEVDFSNWARGLLPELTPSMAMRWDWSQSRTREDVSSLDNRLAVNMAVHW
ncbi:MAG: hypothetical protein EA371_10760 [Gammaproteobacteria bacterium]|nr:MAG: hypothetical protein EA371_10760 [Gammaproteobacteria bacterium]